MERRSFLKAFGTVAAAVAVAPRVALATAKDGTARTVSFFKTTIGGILVEPGDRILFKDQSSSKDNSIWEVTEVGDGGFGMKCASEMEDDDVGRV